MDAPVNEYFIEQAEKTAIVNIIRNNPKKSLDVFNLIELNDVVFFDLAV